MMSSDSTGGAAARGAGTAGQLGGCRLGGHHRLWWAGRGCRHRPSVPLPCVSGVSQPGGVCVTAPQGGQALHQETCGGKRSVCVLALEDQGFGLTCELLSCQVLVPGV